MKKLYFFVFLISEWGTVFSQTVFDSFSDGNYTINHVWTGTANWQISESNVSGGAPSSGTLRLSTQNISGRSYLSSTIYNWSLSQEWGFFIGIRNPVTSTFQSYFWLYANEADLNSATVDGYRIAFGDDLATDRIRLEYIVDGAVSSTIITSAGGTANGINNFGFLLRVKRSAAGVWELFTSTLPQVASTGALATAIPNTANTPVNQGTGTNNALVPVNNGYIGAAALHSTAAFLQMEFDQVYFTASPVSPPVMTVAPSYLDSFLAVWTGPFASSAPKPYIVSGSNLVSDIVIAGYSPPYGNVEVSLTQSPFIPGVIHLTPVSGTVPPTTIYMRISSVYVGNVFDAVEHMTTGIPVYYTWGTGNVIAPEPTVSSSLSFGTRTNNSLVVNMNGGNGDERILFVKESSAVDFNPYDSHIYTTSGGVYAAPNTHVGNGNYSVYKGTGHTVTVTGLTAGKTYHFAVYEFNKIFGQMYPPGPLSYGDDGTENFLLLAGTGSERTTGGTLPIVVNYIKGTKQASKHLLNWKVTCISTPRVTMVLERSKDSRNFTAINSITADAVRCNEPFDYTDTDPLKGMNYYRLKMTDADGKVSYSSIVALLNAAKGFDIISIAPNPVVDDNFKLNVASAQAGKMDIAIFDMQGRLVNRQTITVIAGFNSLPVHVDDLSSGSYTISGSMADEQSGIIRFVKQ